MIRVPDRERFLVLIVPLGRLADLLGVSDLLEDSFSAPSFVRERPVAAITAFAFSFLSCIGSPG